MMKKENRLLKNKDFKQVLDAKASISEEEFIVYKKSNKVGRIRIGISVSSKLGNSVVRHKIKRQISEILKEIMDINKSIDVVIIARNKFLHNSYAVNKEKLKKIFTNIENKVERRRRSEKN